MKRSGPYFPLSLASIAEREKAIHRTSAVSGRLAIAIVNRYAALRWKGGRVVDCSGLENRRWATIRGFESHPFRQTTLNKPALRRLFDVGRDCHPSNRIALGMDKDQPAIRLACGLQLPESWPGLDQAAVNA
jgi:hypothetical protein